jgi:hypothetical protein
VSGGRRCGDAIATREDDTGSVLDDSEPTGGVIVVSLWWEQEEASTWSLRGRVTSTPQLGSARSVSTAVADVDSVLTAVREGVEAFMARPPGIPHG